MKIKSIIDNELGLHLIDSSDPGTATENLLDVIDYCTDKQYPIIKNNDNVYFNEDFCSWLYCDPTDKDLKKELQRKLEKAVPCDDDDYSASIKTIGQWDTANPCCFLSSQCTTVIHVDCIETLKRVRLRYLSASGTSNEFISQAMGCFDNLFFHENCRSSISTLKADFKEISSELSEHLDALDKFHRFVKENRNHMDFRQLGEEFHHTYQIRCSPQAGRDKIKELKVTLVSDDKSYSKEFKCELHTKFKSSDRIYFHPGNSDFVSGKILIFHIGKHM